MSDIFRRTCRQGEPAVSNPFRQALRALAILCICLAAPCAATAQNLLVFAAASLKDALDDVAAHWQSETGTPVTISYAATSALARQIQQGAPADVFISANPDWMDTLQADVLIDPKTRRDLLSNRIVLVAHGSDAPPVDIHPGFDLAGLLGDGRLAMGLVDAVPAGIYGKAALTSLGVWDAVEPKVAQTDTVRAALALVARGEATYGIVYATDATAGDDVTVVATFPGETHPPIVYPVAVTSASVHSQATAFVEYLASDAARPLFAHQGFTVPD
jgi:molybdate transport system substrate-binding protein